MEEFDFFNGKHVSEVKSAEQQGDPKQLRLLVLQALRPNDWKNVQRDSVQVTDTSGQGGNETYKVSCGGADCSYPIVALHSRGNSWYDGSTQRLEAAARHFSDHGVGPKRLAEGVDWWIEGWEGYGEPTWLGANDFRVLGRELAKLHKTPVDWFEPWRAHVKEKCPVLADVPPCSHIWWYACQSLQAFEKDDPAWLAEFVKPMFVPKTIPGARIVTVHGDLKEPNVVSMDPDNCLEGPFEEGKCCGGMKDEYGLKFLDLDWAHVNGACHDLAFICFHYEDMPEKELITKRGEIGAMRRAFLESYLVAMGDPASEEDVRGLLLDTFLAANGHHFGIVAEHSVYGRTRTGAGEDFNPETIAGLKRFKEQAAHLLSSEEEQKKFHELGPEGWMASQGYGDLIKKNSDPEVIKAFKFFARTAESDV